MDPNVTMGGAAVTKDKAFASLHDEYFAICEDYGVRYGKDTTVLLMEVGSFFEMYCVDNENERIGATIFRVAELLNIQLTKKNKSIPTITRGNPYLAGFPSHVFAKHTQTLLGAGYTIVVVRQVTSPPNPQRAVTEVLSPAMQMTPTGADGNYLLVLHWDAYPDRLGRRYLSVGMGAMDVSTGHTWIYEVASTPADPNLALDELVRCTGAYTAREMVLLGNTLENHERERVEVALGVGYDASRTFHRRWDMPVGEFARIPFQGELLQRAFPEAVAAAGILSPLEALGMERYEHARVAFCYMIQFGHEHSESMIRSLRAPEHLVHDGVCTLEHNSALQLNVISQTASERPLLSMLNRCATAFGSRRFRERLLKPITSHASLEARYDAIAGLMEEKRHAPILSALRGVLDLERMARRMLVGTFPPADWPSFHGSMEACWAALSATRSLGGPGGERYAEALAACSLLMTGYTKTLRLDECAKYLLTDIRGNVFVEGVCPEVDAVQAEWKEAMADMEALAVALDWHGAEGCRVESNERDGYSIGMTKRRWENVQKKWRESGIQELEVREQLPAIPISAFVVKASTGKAATVRLQHTFLQARSDVVERTEAKIAALVGTAYRNFVAAYIRHHQEHLYRVIETVGELDVDATCARNATEYHYQRPVLCEGPHSRVKAIAMRHPILERIMERHRYVPNDVSLGCERRRAEGEREREREEEGERNQDTQGLLLFGMNASGKSSLMKAVGLNVLLAQAGMYVAADHMELVPFDHIFTRISSSDNIYKGWSTFTVEMMELRNILQRCDRRSLVLGDELCAGTESLSALAIVAAGLETLCSRGASFVFATHLHDLSTMERITACKDIQLAHMHVEVDAETGRIVYDRQLRPGPGSSRYGLEVCKGLGLPPEFLRLAHEIRCEVEGVTPAFQSATKSRYNRHVFVQECKICEAPATETHHILPQASAAKDGWIQGAQHHKDRAFNLVPLCERCHQRVHHGTLEILGYESTNEGVVLRTKNNHDGTTTAQG